jgi:hypothetical protein
VYFEAYELAKKFIDFIIDQDIRETRCEEIFVDFIKELLGEQT